MGKNIVTFLKDKKEEWRRIGHKMCVYGCVFVME